MDLLLKEVQRSGESGKTLSEVLDQLRVIWTAKNREAVLSRLENHARVGRRFRFPDDMQEPVANALSDLLHSANALKPGDRQKADFSISRIVKYLDTPHQLNVLAPWFEDTRKFRENTVMRSLGSAEDLSPYADYIASYFRKYGDTNTLRLISRSRAASALIEASELEPYFRRYVSNFRARPQYPDKHDKYQAMIAARVLIVGERTIPADLLRSFPEIFSWAIENIGDPIHESMLIWLIVENPENPEVLWSAIRTANRQFMTRALSRVLAAARQLLLMEEGVMVLPVDFNEAISQTELQLPLIEET